MGQAAPPEGRAVGNRVRRRCVGHPALASIRNGPEFKAIFADIEPDMAKQRAALAARPKDAPLDLAATGI